MSDDARWPEPDPRLRAALRHAPDADDGPPPALDAAILRAAQRAVAPRPVWRRLIDGCATVWTQPARAAALASLLMAGFITLLWRGDPSPEALSDAIALRAEGTVDPPRQPRLPSPTGAASKEGEAVGRPRDVPDAAPARRAQAADPAQAELSAEAQAKAQSSAERAAQASRVARAPAEGPSPPPSPPAAAAPRPGGRTDDNRLATRTPSTPATPSPPSTSAPPPPSDLADEPVGQAAAARPALTPPPPTQGGAAVGMAPSMPSAPPPPPPPSPRAEPLPGPEPFATALATLRAASAPDDRLATWRSVARGDWQRLPPEPADPGRKRSAADGLGRRADGPGSILLRSPRDEALGVMTVDGEGLRWQPAGSETRWRWALPPDQAASWLRALQAASGGR